MSTSKRDPAQQELQSSKTHEDLVEIQAAVFSGPLPHPSALEQYNALIPQGAERIMAMAERQSAHRESLEALALRANIARETRGAYFAFVLAVITISGGIFLIHEGKSTSGLVAVIASLGTLLGVFIYSKYEQRRERERKAQTLESRRSRS